MTTRRVVPLLLLAMGHVLAAQAQESAAPKPQDL